MEEEQVFVKLVRRRNKMKRIALTGNIGCGKSYVSKHLAKLGVFVFDCDVLAKEVRAQYSDDISAMFHVDATNPKALASVVFASDEKRVQLENFLYPKIIEKMMDIFKQYENEEIVVIEVPLLFEKNWDGYFDEVWVVSTKEEIALERLLKYRNMSKEEAKQRLQKQMPLIEKEKRADFIIYNNEEDVEKQIVQYMKKEGIVC